jgi:Uma2 family endonuclease
MVQQLTRPPEIRGEWIPMTWEEFVAWPIKGKTEWVAGEGIAYVSTSIFHAKLVQFFATLLELHVRLFGLGQVLTSEALMRLPIRPSGRKPDIMVIRTEHLNRLRTQWLDGPADFVVEFLSDDDPDRDLVVKRREFEREGISEYLAVDARPNQTEFHFLRLVNGLFESVEADEQGRYHSTTLPGFWFK